MLLAAACSNHRHLASEECKTVTRNLEVSLEVNKLQLSDNLLEVGLECNNPLGLVELEEVCLAKVTPLLDSEVNLPLIPLKQALALEAWPRDLLSLVGTNQHKDWEELYRWAKHPAKAYSTINKISNNLLACLEQEAMHSSNNNLAILSSNSQQHNQATSYSRLQLNRQACLTNQLNPSLEELCLASNHSKLSSHHSEEVF
jgi:hypothetical protein